MSKHPFSPNKEMRQLMKRLHAQGFHIDKGRRSGHLKVRTPCGKHTVVMASTPSDGRSIKNAVARLKRHGYQP